jgi:hypothetical protein
VGIWKAKKKEGEKDWNSEVGPVVIPKKRDYAVARMRKAEKKEGEKVRMKAEKKEDEKDWNSEKTEWRKAEKKKMRR